MVNRLRVSALSIVLAGLLVGIPASGLAQTRTIATGSVGVTSQGAALVQTREGMIFGVTGTTKVDETYANYPYHHMYGSIYRVNQSSGLLETVLLFSGGLGGAHPTGGLIQARDGYLYGATASGGVNGDYGTVYRFDSATLTHTVLYRFTNDGGPYQPTGRLVEGPDGRLYGVSKHGGIRPDGVISGSASFGGGTVFALDPRTGALDVLHFFDWKDGAWPLGVTFAPDGALYGVTQQADYTPPNSPDAVVVPGIAFRLRPDGAVDVLHRFDGPQGGSPLTKLLYADGRLFGVAAWGCGSNYGCLYSLTAEGEFAAHANLGVLYGHYELLQASDGRIYGVMPTSGSHGRGSLYSWTPRTGLLSQSSNQEFPTGPAIEGQDGALYAPRRDGVYRFTPLRALMPEAGARLFQTSSYTVMWERVGLEPETPVRVLLASAVNGYGNPIAGGSDLPGTSTSFAWTPANSGYGAITGTWYLQIVADEHYGTDSSNRAIDIAGPFEIVEAPDDTDAPVTTAYSSAGASGDWADQIVNVDLVARDSGSGVASIAYTLTGAQPLAQTTVPGGLALLQISAEGVTTIRFHAVDKAGNVEAGREHVVRIDLTAPDVSVDSPVDGAEYTLGSVVTASYSCSDSLSGIRQCAGHTANGAEVFTGDLGRYALVVDAVDLAGNATSRRILYTVRDNTAPQLTVPGSIVVEATSPGGAVVSFASSALDNRDGEVPVSCEPISGATFVLGNTTVACSATDSSGNVASSSFTVAVVDTTAPVLSLPAAITVDATGPAGASVSFTTAAADVVDGQRPVTCSVPSGATFPIGTTMVTCTAADLRGNAASGAFQVTVKSALAMTMDLAAAAIASGLSEMRNLLDRVVQYVSASRGTLANACGGLNAFVNHVQAQAGKKISGVQAAQLVASAGRLAATMACR